MKKPLLLKRTFLTGLLSFLFSTATINAQSCAANFNFTLGPGGTATFVSISTGTTANTSHSWSTGPGVYSPWGPVVNQSYTDNQIYFVTLTISDTTTIPVCNSSITKTVGVTTVPCFTNVTFYVNSGPNGQVNFVPYPTGPGSGGYSYSWGFGDGDTSTLSKSTHSYATNGAYNVTMTATSYSSVCSYSTTQTVSVSIITCSPNAGFTYTIGSNGLVHFKSSPSGTVPNVTHHWTFGDTSWMVSGSAYDTISHRYPGNLTYQVKHRVDYVNWYYCADSLVQQVPITTMTNCSAFSTISAQKNLSQLLTWDIWATYPTSVTSVTWDWGDNSSTTTGLTPSHTYSAAGWYNICATVSVPCGSTYSMCIGKYFNRMSTPEQADMIVVNVKKTNENIVGIQSVGFEKTNIVLWPNPNNGNFELKVEGVELNSSFVLKITNLLGQTLYTEALKNESASINKTIKLESLPAGTYFLSLQSQKSSSVTKIIVAK